MIRTGHFGSVVEPTHYSLLYWLPLASVSKET
jgi:hypothetical protein